MHKTAYKHKLHTKTLIVGKNYKIIEAHKFVKAKIVIANDSVIIVMKGNVEKDIYVKQIKEIKAQEFSVLKTVGFTLGIGLVVFGIIAAVEFSSFDLGGGFGY